MKTELPASMANTHQNEPPKVEPLPVKSIAPPSGDNTQNEEWETYKAGFIAAMATVREARESLQHPTNQERAWKMAAELGEVFKKHA